MSGHNKWSTIKHKKAANDAANAKVFTKYGREIMVAVKLGGPDPSSNPRLKNIIQKAKAANMPNDNINRSIKRASGGNEGVNYENMVYEGYGPCGSALIVECLTDNKNRTASDVRHAFDKFGGSLGSTGCVSYLFNRKGVMIVLKGIGISEDDLMMHALEAGAEDVVVEEDCYIVYTTPEDLETVKTYFDDNNLKYESAESTLVPSNYVDIPAEKMGSFNKLIDMLEDNDDVQEVYHNVNLPDEDEE